MTVKSRTNLQKSSVFRRKIGSVNSTFRADFYGSQQVTTNGHRWPPRGRSASSDSGGNFLSLHSYWEKPGGESVYIRTVDYNLIDDGKVYAWFNGGVSNFLNAPSALSDASMNALGTTGIARTLPTKPLSGAGQFIGELKDLPRFAVETWKARTKGFMALAKGGSKDYLNAQFGWIPFIRDIQEFTEVTRDSTKHIQQFLRDSGRTVRRRTTLYDTTSTTVSLVTDSWFGVPAIQSSLVRSAGQVRKTTVVKDKSWFSGAFSYYVPQDNELFDPKTGKANLSKIIQQNEQLANRLYGLRITPHLLWQLAPWSWAVDWVSNAGDVINNMQAFTKDNLVLKYGYVMRESSVTETYAVTRPLILGNGRSVQDVQVIKSETKQRSRATPYGFGLSPAGFTNKQWAIIGALGISKAPRSLTW